MNRKERKNRIKYLRRVLREGGAGSLPRQLDMLDEMIPALAGAGRVTFRDLAEEEMKLWVGSWDPLPLAPFYKRMAKILDYPKHEYDKMERICLAGLSAGLSDREQQLLFNTAYQWALFRWEAAPVIYKLDPELAEMLRDTEAPAKVPQETFRQFPQNVWAVQLPEGLIEGTSFVIGCINKGSYDGSQPDQVVGVGLGQGGYMSCLSRCSADSPDKGDNLRAKDSDESESMGVSRMVVNVAMYLATEKPDLQPAHKPFRRHGKGVLAEPGLIGVGQRIGAQIRALKTERKTGNPLDRARHTPAAHLRRGHWRMQWYGSRTVEHPSGTSRKVIWVRPSIIGVGLVNPTVRDVL